MLIKKSMKMPDLNGYKILFVLIHILYTIFESIWRTIAFIYQTCIKIIHLDSKSIDVDQLQRRLSKLSKKPQHITLILSEEEYSNNDLTNIILWCLAVDIPFISFYDSKGNLKKQEEKLQQLVNSKKSENSSIIWHSCAGIMHKNGFVGKKIHVKILTEEDGKENIVNLTKTLALSKQKDISREIVSEYLQKQYEFPDPDLALINGKSFYVYNYPPWQLRLTEFFNVKSICNITFSIFLKYLEKYSNCEQRVGT